MGYIKDMKELSVSQFRKIFISTLDKSSKTNLPIIVNRENSQWLCYLLEHIELLKVL